MVAESLHCILDGECSCFLPENLLYTAVSVDAVFKAGAYYAVIAGSSSFEVVGVGKHTVYRITGNRLALA